MIHKENGAHFATLCFEEMKIVDDYCDGCGLSHQFRWSVDKHGVTLYTSDKRLYENFIKTAEDAFDAYDKSRDDE